MDDDLQTLVRTSVREALVRNPDDVAVALEAFGWTDFVTTDEAFACTVLFEELGYLGVAGDALDVVTAEILGLDERAAVIWPLGPGPDDGTAAGVLLRGDADSAHRVLGPVQGRLVDVEPASIEAAPLGGMAGESGWVRVRAAGRSGADHGAWDDVLRRARLALASELVGSAQRILEVAVEQVCARRQFGRPIAANQAVRFRLAEAYAEMAGARALAAAAWDDGSASAAAAAKEVAGGAHDAVGKHALQVCGAIGFSEEHALPALVRRGYALDALLHPGAPTSVDVPVAVGSF
jgi:hypothetical protein